MSDTDVNDKEKKPVANGKITSGRRSVFRVIFDEVIVKNYQDIKNNFVQDIIIPVTVDWLYNVCEGFVNDMFKTPNAGRGSTLPREYGSSSYKSYSKSYKSGSSKRRDRDESTGSFQTYKDISFDNRREAEKVIADLRGDIIEYGLVTIQDLCQYSGVEGTWADVNYGWLNLDKAGSFRARDGRYYLNLPEPKPIEQD